MRSQLEALQAEVVRLLSRVDELEAHMEQAAEWFQQYADSHAAKGDTDKAARNQNRADACRAAIMARADEPWQPIATAAPRLLPVGHEHRYVLAYCPKEPVNDRIRVVSREGDQWEDDMDRVVEPSHWMPLPLPPGEGTP